MSLPTQSKTAFPVYAGNDMTPIVPQPNPKGRRITTNVAMAVSVVLMLACAWGVITTVTDPDYNKYNRLLAEYNTLQRQQAPAMARRAPESNSAAYITTTTTVTQGTTVTFETTASSSSIPATFTSVSAAQNATSSASGACGTASAQTVTVTITAEPSVSVVGGTPIGSSAPQVSFVSFSIFSSIEPTTVVETRLTTATVTVTASGHTTPKPETQTFTATATEGQTSTEIITVHPGGGNRTLTGTSTSTADAVLGTGSHTARYPNATISLTPYGASASGGDLASTASYTLTVPAGHTGGTGRATTPFYTTTSQADPVGTIVTVSGASKMGGVVASTVAAVAAAAVFVMLF
ncbi:hypothetical protein F503_07966 [Ophiostoma piceae UAMH 11346]|uniref:Uncharacterized protein n=1 Tax=Ophiostoma piceae (strain UAMH 11346) TaxID=1262450 RepID=S3D227_OPHP1|nr:hypothetical protein F503_07966 [Ophiostoma piceae UAMH 11346]